MSVVKAFHGGHLCDVERIVSDGFNRSTGGRARLGEGVYFAMNWTTASLVPEWRPGKGPGVVYECTLYVSNTFDSDSRKQPFGRRFRAWAAFGYDSAKALHPAGRCVPYPFQEIVVDKPSAIRIDSISMAKTHIPISLPVRESRDLKRCAGSALGQSEDKRRKCAAAAEARAGAPGSRTNPIDLEELGAPQVILLD